MSTSLGWEGKGRYGSFRQRMNAECAGERERVPYLSALEVCSRQGAIQIHVYLYLTGKDRIQVRKVRKVCKYVNDCV